MRFEWYGVSILTAAALVVIGLLSAPFVFAERAFPGASIGTYGVGGVHLSQMEGVLDVFEERMANTPITLRLRGKEAQYTIGELGFTLDREETVAAVKRFSIKDAVEQRHIKPVIRVNAAMARSIIHEDFSANLSLPQNATLKLTESSELRIVPSESGEQADMEDLVKQVTGLVAANSQDPIDLVAVSAPAPVQDDEVFQAKALGESLLADGLKLTFEEEEYNMRPFTIRRMISFIEQADASNEGNFILGIAFDREELEQYLVTTIVPSVNQEAVNARFERNEDRVEQFTIPQQGQVMNIEQTIEDINQALALGRTEAALVVEIQEPDVADAADIESLGLTSLLARGESDFVGSPANRMHNIEVGASRYHGLLVAPGEEFSFNKFLGPVTAAAGFKPELVIKQNVTVPEFGGGLCQVSTTIFRAAAHAGMEITERRAHSYAVQYYGAPGFDATIYPGYTDLRFLNNTPGYILVQAKIEGTKLFFEFWGTDDNREVEIVGPVQYDRQSNGAVKATLKQIVTRNGEVIIEDTFYSNYRSPDLFPRVLSANGEAQPEAVEAAAQPHDTNDEQPADTASAPADPEAANEDDE